MNLGLDIHGVIDKDPKFFSQLTHLLIEDGHEIHIITGVRWELPVAEELELDFNIRWTHDFSITSYHEALGTPMTYKNGNRKYPLIEDILWDKTKADYCNMLNIDFHLDDSKVYGKYFEYIKTKYIEYIPGMFTVQNFPII